MGIKKKTHGGSRPGSGRPKKEPTVTISFRVKAKHVEKSKAAVKKLIDRINKG